MNNYYFLNIKTYWFLFQSWKVNKSLNWIHSYNDFLISFKGILSTIYVIFSYPKLLSISVLTFIKWRLNIELLTNTLRNVVFSIKKADHRYWKLINYALTWARPNLFLSIFMPVACRFVQTSRQEKDGTCGCFESCQFRPHSVFFLSWRLNKSAGDFRCLRYYCDNVSIS
jgi:hypothetical protein